MDSKSPSKTSDAGFRLVAIFAVPLGIYGLSQHVHRWWNTPIGRLAVPLLLGITLAVLIALICRALERSQHQAALERAVLGNGEDAVYCGLTDKEESVFVKPKQRAMHTQVVGTTNAGKTESVILPWAIQDIEQGRGLLLIDGKADRSLLEKLWAYTLKSGRSKDFRLFSLSDIGNSHQFNPLVGGSPEEISERVFNAFEFENPHYRSLQYEVFSQLLRIFIAAGEVPTFLRLHQAINTPNVLVAMARKVADPALRNWADFYRDLPLNERTQRTSGLSAAISHFAFGQTSFLFNADAPGITLDKALRENLIVYFQLPVLFSPFLGRATGKMILQSLQSAVANRHRGASMLQFYSVFLDDFSEYLYPGFVSILNKSRSANVGVVFAHQALGDIHALGDATANSILTNSNLKIFMRGNDPDSAEYFSKVVGTVKSVKSTERHTRGIWKDEATGERSIREVDEFEVHPNRFKRELGVGEAVMVLPHERGSKVINIKFRKYDDLKPASALPDVLKEQPKGLAAIEQLNESTARGTSSGKGAV
jgi:hypothetical protein